MNTRRYQTTDDVIARAQGRPAQPPHVPFRRFRSTGWIAVFCVLGAAAMLVGVVLAFGH